MLFKSRRNEYADTDGPVRYLDDSGLRRPLDMPRPQIAIMFAFVLVAALIGGYLLFNVLDAVRGGTARAQASVEENLSREVSYDLPALTSYITLNDDEIKQPSPMQALPSSTREHVGRSGSRPRADQASVRRERARRRTDVQQRRVQLPQARRLAAQRFVDARRRPQRRHVHATALRRFLFGQPRCRH